MRKMTTRKWWEYVEVLAAREAFKTSGALHGGSPGLVGTYGRLPHCYRSTLWHAVDYAVYSYATPIAWHRSDTDSWEMPDEKYSPTTSHHQSLIGTALAELRK